MPASLYLYVPMCPIMCVFKVCHHVSLAVAPVVNVRIRLLPPPPDGTKRGTPVVNLASTQVNNRTGRGGGAGGVVVSVVK